MSNQWYGCLCLGCLTCTQMLMPAIAYGGCTDTVRESALEVDSGRKIPCRTGDSNSNVRLTEYGPLLSFQGRSSSASSLDASLLQAIDGVMSLALCPQLVSQASHHFRSSETQATCEVYFARQSICSVVSLHPGMSRAVHPQEFSKVYVDHWHIPVFL